MGTPAPLPPRLLAHMRRWARLKLIAECSSSSRQAGRLGQWEAFSACRPRCYWELTATTTRTSCTARHMPLHPSTGFRWLNRWLNLKALGKEGKKPNDILVGVAGFEPATPASRTQCSTGLSHTPTRTRLIALGFAHRKKPN